MTLYGLTANDRAAYLRALTTDTQVQATVNLLTLSHGLVSAATPVALDGQVNFTPGDGVAKTLQMGFIDPDHALRLDGGAPTQGVAGLNRLIQVKMWVYVAELGRWVGVETFTGRPSQVDRDGDTVTVEAQGKECLHLRTMAAFTIPKGTNYGTAIKRCLIVSGETRFRFTTGITSKLAGTTVVGGTDEAKWPWRVARRLARQIGLQLYYDGSGYACLRRPPTTPTWTLVEQGDGANLTDRIKTTTNLLDIRNRVVVTGRTTGKSPKALKLGVNAPSAHPHSAQSLAVNGVPWFNTAYYDEPNLHTKAAVLAFARARLTELLTQSVSVQTTAIPFWHAEPGDLMRLVASTAAFNFPLSETSIPLGPSDTGQTIGYQQRVRAATAGRIRRAA